MKIAVSMIHVSTPLRMDALIKTLLRYGHQLCDPCNADIWFVDCIWPHRLDKEMIASMLSFRGKIILISLGDLNLFNLSGLPDELINKTTAFAKIQWSNDPAEYDTRILDKKLTIHPFLIGGLPSKAEKEPKACFWGLPTGSEQSEDNLRIRACKILKPNPWFIGGIVGQEPGAILRDISGIETGHRPRVFYLNAINRTLLSICMPGNSPLTYRLFESLGVGSVVVSCCLDEIEWLNKLVPGEHYLAVKSDLSDLQDICDTALVNTDLTTRIATDGYNIHLEYYAIQTDGGLSDQLWGNIRNQLSELGIEL